MDSTPSFSTHRSNRKYRGVSPVIASVIILGITVVLGLALWTFVNGEVNTSTEVFANEVSDYVNFLNDRYVIVNIAFNHDSLDGDNGDDDSEWVSVWIYNNGNLSVKVNSVFFGQGSSDMKLIDTWFGRGEFDGDIIDVPADGDYIEIPTKKMGVISFDCRTVDPPCDPLVLDATYYVRIVSQSGATQTYFQKNGD